MVLVIKPRSSAFNWPSIVATVGAGFSLIK
jgi:hypothetical protein